MADHRSLRVYQRKSKARDALWQSLRSAPSTARLLVYGIVKCEYITWAANQNRAARRDQEGA
jgi:hypothetical protein